MSRIIINYDDDIPVENAISYVDSVVSLGRCSGEKEECFCYFTTFKDGTLVMANMTKTGTDVFTISSGKDGR